jgi:hypothetical protein
MDILSVKRTIFIHRADASTILDLVPALDENGAREV